MPPQELTADQPTGRAPSPLRPWHAWLTLCCGGIAAQAVGTGFLAAAIALGPAGKGTDPSERTALALSSLPVVLSVFAVTEGTLLAAALLPPLLLRRSWVATLGLRLVPWSVFAFAVLGTVGASLTGELMLWLAAQLLPGLTTGALDQLARLMATHPVWVLWPVLALLPGVAEELLFRGMLQRALGNTWRAIALSAVLFAAYHVDPHHALATLPLGLFLAWVAARSDSSLVAIAGHIVNNSLALVAARFFAPVGSDPGGSTPLISAGLGIVLLVGSICGLRAVEKRGAHPLS